MSRGMRTHYPETGGYDPCEYGGGMAPSKSSSGTSMSSCPQPVQTQRYPQTTSARRKNCYDSPGMNRMYMSAEPCLSNTPDNRYTEYSSLARPVSPYSGRNTSSGYTSRPASPRTPSPGSSYKQRQQMEENCDALNTSFRGPKRQVQFDCDSPEEPRATRASQPRTPRTPGLSAQCSSRTPSPMRPKCPPANSQESPCRPTYQPVESRVSDTFNPEELNALFGKLCPNLDPEAMNHCSFKEYNEDDKDEGFLSKIMKKFKGQPNPCPLKVDFSHRKARNYGALMRKKSSCFSKKEREDQSLDQLDDLWNPDTFMRWKCIDNWDQHKESLWRSVIQAKLDCPESHNRSIEDMMYDAFKAMNAPGGECISYRMIYGILRRNEDLYLNAYIDHFTDEQFLKLVVALNRFYMEDKDKRKTFFDHPPPTFIEKIMMKETLGVLDPTSPGPLIARRFWELLLDWYARKINSADTDDCDKVC
uniref:Uncharacterized protein n=1 Tax=Lygus hesperus TaxID=30085 RepID=A0A0A9WH89_LYGHE